MPDSPKVLVIDDQIGVEGSPSREAFVDNYGELGYEFVFSTAQEGPGRYSVAAALGDIEYHSDAALIILDIKFGRESDRLGVDILSEASVRYPLIPIVMMTSLESEPSTVVKCMRLGARDYITKGSAPEAVAETLKRYARRVTESHLILGNSPKIKDLRSLVELAARDSTTSVLIIGERGTGKELVARSIHFLGRRRSFPFVAVNCAAFPKDLLQAELYGAEKGAYTGADRTKYGYLELANGGVLFLDEITEASDEVQLALRRVLQERTFRRLGVSKAEISVDFQLVCATNAMNLEELVERNQFRKDFRDRINVFEIRTIPLRESLDDMEFLAHHFLRDIQESRGGTSYHVKGFDPAVIDRFRSYAWPGNYRELRNVVERAMIFAPGEMIRLEDLPRELSDKRGPGAGLKLPVEGMDLNYKMAEIELEYLKAAYEACGRNKALTMQRFYPGLPANYFDRLIFDAAARSAAALNGFPDFEEMYQRECQRRERAIR